jgi:hypothetical protein
MERYKKKNKTRKTHHQKQIEFIDYFPIKWY